MSLYDRILDKLARSSPGPVAGVIDLLRPSLANGLGGPFNGQQKRLDAVREVFNRVAFESVIETGTYRGTTTRLLGELSSAPIATIEADSRYHTYARLKLARRHVAVLRGDSPLVLRTLASAPPWNRNPAFFYLDAHWLEALPLPAELAVIADGWRDFAVLIDDFKVPGDAGYGYDDYGPGRALELQILRSVGDKDIVVYWPSAGSASETGARRGWILLASVGFVDDALHPVDALRRAGHLSSVILEDHSGNPR